MSTALGRLFRQVTGFITGDSRMRPIELNWVVTKAGVPICNIHSAGPRPDMFWREYAVEVVQGGPTAELLSDDGYWEECDFVIRHESLALSYDSTIVRAIGPLKVSVRGLPDLVSKRELRAVA